MSAPHEVLSERENRTINSSKTQSQNTDISSLTFSSVEVKDYRQIITMEFFQHLFGDLVEEREIIETKSEIVLSLQSFTAPEEGKAQDGDTCSNICEINSEIASQEINDENQLVDEISQENSQNSEDCFFLCDCEAPRERLVFKNGNFYVGQLSDNVMHGKGKFYWLDGTIYEGNFKNGTASGKGKITLPDLSTYQGEFATGTFHGHGILNVVGTPVFYRGQWRRGKKNGKGWIKYGINDCYEGEWLDDLRHGNGYRKYSDGIRYQGEWRNGKRHGQGRMIWNNNDYYEGEWADELPQGYGEYTWNLQNNSRLVFADYNWYKGSWVAGIRNGIGLMNFGHPSGARLAGTWKDNLKAGPGIMLCGNGHVIQRNPLFEDDKPCDFKSKPLQDINLDGCGSADGLQMDPYTILLHQINSKKNLTSIDKENLNVITHNGHNLRMEQYIKLLDKNSKSFCPLKIPIHICSEEVNLDYYVDLVMSTDMDFMDCSIFNVKQYLSAYESNPESNVNLISSKTTTLINLPIPSVSQGVLTYRSETTQLKNVLSSYATVLRNIYDQYASLTVPNDEKLTFEPCMVRLFLWQLYRDIGLPDKGVTLVESDRILSCNPNSFTESNHNPFEKIYFWQFLQSLMGNAFLLYIVEERECVVKNKRIVAHILKQFLDQCLLPNYGVHRGLCLTELRDLVSIRAMYSLYCRIGEPHSISSFLKNVYEKPKCYLSLTQKKKIVTRTGSNAVIGSNVIFLETNPAKPIETDGFYQSLHTFSCIGKKTMVKCLSTVCPRIMQSGKIDKTYKLVFIEFYEIVLLLTYEKVEMMRLKMVEEMQKALEEHEVSILIVESESSKLKKNKKDRTKKK